MTFNHRWTFIHLRRRPEVRCEGRLLYARRAYSLVILDSSLAAPVTDDSRTASPNSLRRKGPAPPPPPRPAKTVSVKARQAPTINDIHCVNNDHKQAPSSTPVVDA